MVTGEGNMKGGKDNRLEGGTASEKSRRGIGDYWEIDGLPPEHPLVWITARRGVCFVKKRCRGVGVRKCARVT